MTAPAPSSWMKPLLVCLLLSCVETSPDVAAADTPLTAAALVEIPAITTPAPLEVAPAPSPRLSTDADAQLKAPPANRRLYIQVDRPIYRPGDTIWIKTWDLEAATLSSTATRTVTYTLTNARGIRMGVRKVQSVDGMGTNDFVVPTNTGGGMYTLTMTTDDGATASRPLLVASTDAPRMRKELTFLRDAYGPGDTVVAAISIEGAASGPYVDHPLTGVVQIGGEVIERVEVTTNDAGEATVRFTLPDGLRSSDGHLSVVVADGGVSESISRAIPILINDLSVDFYPEGGDLVTGLPSRVYLEARDVYGKPADLAGEILSSAGEVVAQIRTAHDGLGRFDLTPLSGEGYSLRVTEPAGLDTTFPLPEARSDGCVLRTFDDLNGDRENIRTQVACTKAQTVVLSATRDGAVSDGAEVAVAPGVPGIVYLSDGGRQGVAMVTASNADLEPIAERLVYRGRGRQLNVTLTPDAETYSPRDEVTLRLKATDHTGEPVAARLAVSVADDTLLKYADDKQGHILSAMYLEGALPRAVEEPGWYFDPEEELAALGLDLLMGTHGWRRLERVAVAVASAEVPELPDRYVQVKPEGKVGKKAAKMKPAKGNRVEVARRELDREISENAGVLGALGDAARLDGVFGSSSLDADLTGGIGSGGLGSKGSGLGGGGTAEGLGGLGTKGIGSGASGYGSGGGVFGAKGEGGIGRIDGEPIILGALDKNLIDAVIKRHMNQIRYCYQRELNKDPSLAGKIVIKIVIDKTGAVTRAQTKTSTMSSAAVENCITSRFMRFQFPEPRGGGIVIVSYPFLFSPDESSLEDAESRRPITRPAPPVFSTVRIFPRPTYSGAAPELRTDFRETVLWDPNVRTDDRGEATIQFHLSDAVTTFRATAEGIGSGQAGRGEATLSATRPFSLSARLPEALGAGDTMVLPVQLRSTRDADAGVALSAAFSAPLQYDGPADSITHLPADAALQQTYTVTALPENGMARLTLTATADGLTDHIEKSIPVTYSHFPGKVSLSSTVTNEFSQTITIDDAIDGTLEARLAVYTHPVSQLLDGIEGMLKEPRGCFEQTSSFNYPNTMVLQHLERTPDIDPAVVQRARELLDRGYSRLVSFESEGGGFDWFGGPVGHEELTAYGLQQFVDMARVYSGVSPQMLARTSRWLLGRRDGDGGYQVRTDSSHRFGRKNAEVTAGYVTYSLAQTGHTAGMSKELDYQERIAEESEDPYLLSLAALALLKSDRARDARPALDKLVRLQDADGAWKTAQHTITNSGDRDRAVETTGLAVLALLESEGHRSQAANGVMWLYSQRSGVGTFGATQATVLALKAIVAFEESSPTPESGRLSVLINGEPVESIAFTGREKSALVLSDLARHFHDGENTLTIRSTAGHSMPFSFGARFRRITPEDSADAAALDLATTLLAESVAQGETVRMTAVVKNLRGEDVTSPMVRLGIPAGLTADLHQLKRMVERKEVAAFELQPREVILYLDGIEGAGERTFHLDLSADVPGSYTAPPSSAWLYYDRDARDWEPGEVVEVVL